MNRVQPYIYFVIILWSIVTHTRLLAQEKSANDTIRLGGVMEQGVLAPMAYLDEFTLTDKLPEKWVKRQAEYDRLKRNVYKVYPYAVIAAGVLKDTYEQADKIEDKKARKRYIKSVEADLKKKFKGELENLSIHQGQVLVKLINRQTGRDCFSIIKEVKGGFNAVVYQSVALLFNNSLRKDYDPTGDDKDIEAIVREMEATHYYQYYYNKQQLKTYQ